LAEWKFETLDPAYGQVTEGPSWDGSGLLYTRIQHSKIMRFDAATGVVSLWRDNTNCANGMTFDAQGRLYACEGGATIDARRVVRYENDGSVTVLADRFEGKRLNIPNDIVVDPEGSVWFTDPFYEGAAGPWSFDRGNKELDHDSVYRLDPQADGSYSISRVTFDTTRPNGLLFSLDYKILYVAQSGRENGMRLDTEGHVIATAGWEIGGPGPLMYVFAPSGEVVKTHPVPCTRPTNCAFGGDDLTTLYVTTIEGFLFRAPTEHTGRPLYRGPGRKI
jgi:gluconolactonase